MSNTLLFALMFVAGTTIALQPVINGRLALKIGIVESAFVSFAVGSVALLFVLAFAGRGNLRAITDAAWWELTGGLLGAFFVAMTIISVPRIGAASTMAAVIAAQLLAGLVIDNTGAFGLRTIPLDPKRIAGAVLLFGGALLIFKR
jgi:bacterial/archaeal transporter family-2 protein